jgi:hypothetical protein
VVALAMTKLLLAASKPLGAQQLAPCTTSCAQMSVVGGTLSGTIDIPITFMQAPNDNQGSSGNDDIAAIAFTLGLGSATSPLALSDCDDIDSDGLPDAVSPSAAIADFRVVIENASCTNRNRCLCPTEGGQTRDNFINVVVYGPKDLPTTGPVNIPRIPSGELLTVTLKADPPVTQEQTETLRIFAETDLTNAKPQFGAYLSIGDQGAVDQTADRGTNVSKVNVTTAANVTIQPGPVGDCVGDCDGNGSVAVNELVTGVNIALGRANISACPVFDSSNNGMVEVNELVTGVNNALRGCPE